MMGATRLCFDSAASSQRRVREVGTLVAVSSAAGPACHWRVQVRDAPNSPWRCYGKFRRIDQAEESTQVLNMGGVQTRIVRFAIAPVAG